MVSAAFKIESSKAYELPLTGLYATFAGKICSKLKQDDNDCIFGININEYNNFGFTDKGRINFKVQVVYDAGPDSRFRKLSPKLEVGKSIFITGLLDLSDDDLPFIEAKEINLLEDSDDRSNINSQSLFSRAQKFRANKNILMEKEKVLEDTTEKTTDEKIHENPAKDDPSVQQVSDGKLTKRNNKRKKKSRNSQSQKKTVTMRSQKKSEDFNNDGEDDGEEYDSEE
jgi:hypothetical protein